MNDDDDAEDAARRMSPPTAMMVSPLDPLLRAPRSTDVYGRIRYIYSRLHHGVYVQYGPFFQRKIQYISTSDGDNMRNKRVEAGIRCTTPPVFGIAPGTAVR